MAVDAILASNEDLIARIKLCYGCDAETFRADLLVPIRRYLEYVNQLPATADSYFSCCGGLARIGLETAFYALQATDSQIFAGRATISNRRLLEPRWRRATFLAGLCNEIHRTLSHIRVSDGHSRQWQPYLLPLSRWAQQHGVARLHIRWLDAQESRALGLFALPMVVPAETMCDLARDNATIVPHMLASIAGATMYHEHNVMYRLVRHAAALVIHRNLRAHSSGASPKPGIHLARYLIEAMRELVLSNHGWQPNVGRSRLWYGQDGLFMVWPNGLNDVIKLLEDERLPGIPANASAALDVLVSASLIDAQDPGGRVWSIYPPQSSESIEAIRLSTPTSILAVLTPKIAPLPLSLLTKSQPHAPDKATEPAAVAPADRSVPQHRRQQRTAPSTASDKSARAEYGQLELPEVGEANCAASSMSTAEGGVATSDAGRRGAADPSIGDERQGKQSGKSKRQGPALSAPMRLNPEVARVLAEIICTLHSETASECHVDAGILFVPLGALARRGIDARLAQRALADAGMLALQPSGERIHTRDVSGIKTPGLMINADCVTGLASES